MICVSKKKLSVKILVFCDFHKQLNDQILFNYYNTIILYSKMFVFYTTLRCRRPDQYSNSHRYHGDGGAYYDVTTYVYLDAYSEQNTQYYIML
jgi:hypothetical protein